MTQTLTCEPYETRLSVCPLCLVVQYKHMHVSVSQVHSVKYLDPVLPAPVATFGSGSHCSVVTCCMGFVQLCLHKL